MIIDHSFFIGFVLGFILFFTLFKFSLGKTLFALSFILLVVGGKVLEDPIKLMDLIVGFASLFGGILGMWTGLAINGKEEAQKKKGF